MEHHNCFFWVKKAWNLHFFKSFPLFLSLFWETPTCKISSPYSFVASACCSHFTDDLHFLNRVYSLSSYRIFLFLLEESNLNVGLALMTYGCLQRLRLLFSALQVKVSLWVSLWLQAPHFLNSHLFCIEGFKDEQLCIEAVWHKQGDLV